MSNVKFTIDGKPVSAPAENTILEAAQNAGIRIPTLCYLKDQSVKANCRVCLVEVKGAKTLQPACATKIAEGMDIRTDAPAVRDARRMSLHLILSHHPIDCQSCVRLNNSYLEDLDKDVCSACFYCDCVRDGDCELQQLVEEYEVNYLKFPWQQREEPVDRSAASIVRNPNKCIRCRRCVSACGEIQDIHVWGVTGRGGESRVDAAFGLPLAETDCVECGQCVRSCPVASLQETQEFDDLPDAIADKAKTVQVRVEPYFLERYLELAQLDPDRYGMQNLIAGLHRLGVDTVLKNGPAEEATTTDMRGELAGFSGVKPLISANCPASVRFVEKHFPQLADRLSGVPSPQQRFGKDAADHVYSVSLSACGARKMEAARDGGDGVSLVMSPREINRLFIRSGADPTKLPPRDFDAQDGKHFEAINAAHQPGIVTGKITVGGKSFKTAAAYGLGAARQLLEQVSSGGTDCDYIQLQACPEGCISTNAWLIP